MWVLSFIHLPCRKVQCKADSDENNSLSSGNYGPGILLRALYMLSYLTGISIKIEINRNNDQTVAFVVKRDCLWLFLLNFPDEQFLCSKLVTLLSSNNILGKSLGRLGKKYRLILDSDNNCKILIGYLIFGFRSAVLKGLL